MFSDFETALRKGRKRHLFAFARQSVTWRFINAPKDATLGGNTYTAAPVVRSEIKETIEAPQDNITITFPYNRNPDATELPATQALGDNWHPYVPSDRITVTCMAYHANDPDAEVVVEWQGVVQSAKFNDKASTFELTCIPTTTANNGLRRGPKCQRNCWKSTYSNGPRGCNLDPAPLTISTTLTAVSGLSLTSPDFATATYNLAGGELAWTRGDGIVEKRPIMAHSGDTIQVLYFGTDLAVGTDVTALPDCPHTWQACSDRSNTGNYGGSVYEPIEDPYSGQSMSWSA